MTQPDAKPDINTQFVLQSIIHAIAEHPASQETVLLILQHAVNVALATAGILVIHNEAKILVSHNIMIDDWTIEGRPAFFDLGYGYDQITARLQKEMDKLIVIVEPNSAALTMARELIHEISQVGGAGRINLVVVNRSQSSLQTPWQQVEDVVGLDIKAIIAAAPELAFQATEAGMPMVLLQPGAVVSSQMIKLAQEVKTRIKSLA